MFQADPVAQILDGRVEPCAGTAGGHRLRTTIGRLLPGGSRAGNWTEYTPRHIRRQFIFCGWMDLHDDRNNGVAEMGREWSFRAYYWDPEAVFVHTLPRRGGMVAVERTAEIVTFRADLRHALVPRHLVAAVMRRRPCSEMGLDFSREIRPRLVWRWIHRPTGQEYVRNDPARPRQPILLPNKR